MTSSQVYCRISIGLNWAGSTSLLEGFALCVFIELRDVYTKNKFWRSDPSLGFDEIAANQGTICGKFISALPSKCTARIWCVYPPPSLQFKPAMQPMHALSVLTLKLHDKRIRMHFEILIIPYSFFSEKICFGLLLLLCDRQHN